MGNEQSQLVEEGRPKTPENQSQVVWHIDISDAETDPEDVPDPDPGLDFDSTSNVYDREAPTVPSPVDARPRPDARTPPPSHPPRLTEHSSGGVRKTLKHGKEKKRRKRHRDGLGGDTKAAPTAQQTHPLGALMAGGSAIEHVGDVPLEEAEHAPQQDELPQVRAHYVNHDLTSHRDGENARQGDSAPEMTTPHAPVTRREDGEDCDADGGGEIPSAGAEPLTPERPTRKRRALHPTDKPEKRRKRKGSTSARIRVRESRPRSTCIA